MIRAIILVLILMIHAPHVESTPSRYHFDYRGHSLCVDKAYLVQPAAQPDSADGLDQSDDHFAVRVPIDEYLAFHDQTNLQATLDKNVRNLYVTIGVPSLSRAIFVQERVAILTGQDGRLTANVRRDPESGLVFAFQDEIAFRWDVFRSWPESREPSDIDPQAYLGLCTELTNDSFCSITFEISGYNVDLLVGSELLAQHASLHAFFVSLISKWSQNVDNKCVA